jgi:Predicted enzyme related to lactoylglutathione lyase
VVVNLNQVTLPVLDVEAAVSFYQGMGLNLIVHSPHYARFECPQGDATFSVHIADTAPATGCVVYFECEDLDERVEQLRGKGFVFSRLPTDEHWLWREARLQDPSGNEICLFRAGGNRRNPPWRVGGQR